MANDVSRDNEQFIAREQLIARLSESRRQLDAGEYVEYDDSGLKRFFDALRKRARHPHG
jgi:hypothetical protein